MFAVLEHDCLRNVVGIVNDNPGINQRTLAEELGVTATAARKHVRRLVQEGILEATRSGKQVHYELAREVPMRILEEDTRDRAGGMDAWTQGGDDPFIALATLHGAVEDKAADRRREATSIPERPRT